jgi:thymidylate synthase (FAD)
VVQAARVSYGRGTRKVSEDAGLIRYLMRHRHTTPFEMCDQVPREAADLRRRGQWIRHRTANVNEYSARYFILDREFYLLRRSTWPPSPSSTARAAATSSPARKPPTCSTCCAATPCATYDHYTRMLNTADDGTPADPTRQGLARELRPHERSTLNTYTQWYWKTDLHNLLHFLCSAPTRTAQYDIRAYAEAMLASVAAWVPATYGAFQGYRLGAATFSANQLAVLRRMLKGEAPEQKGSGLSEARVGRDDGEPWRRPMIVCFGSINLDLIFPLPRLRTPARPSSARSAEDQSPAARAPTRPSPLPVTAPRWSSPAAVGRALARAAPSRPCAAPAIDVSRVGGIEGPVDGRRRHLRRHRGPRPDRRRLGCRHGREAEMPSPTTC